MPDLACTFPSSDHVFTFPKWCPFVRTAPLPLCLHIWKPVDEPSLSDDISKYSSPEFYCVVAFYRART